MEKQVVADKARLALEVEQVRAELYIKLLVYHSVMIHAISERIAVYAMQYS
jgi:hypothetical protein